MPTKEPRPPPPSSDSASRVMRANRAKATRPERELLANVKRMKLRGFRLNLPGLPGRPDIAFPEVKLAVFVHGCFWHHHSAHLDRMPRANAGYWRAKFARNEARDRRKIRALRVLGWRTLVVWECQVQANPVRCVGRIARRLASNRIV